MKLPPWEVGLPRDYKPGLRLEVEKRMWIWGLSKSVKERGGGMTLLPGLFRTGAEEGMRRKRGVKYKRVAWAEEYLIYDIHF